MSGKGSSPRPYSVDSETFASNWDRAFGRKSLGSGVTGSASNSNFEGSRSSLDSPATMGTAPVYAALKEGGPESRGPIYINPETGEEVGPDWWPDITTG